MTRLVRPPYSLPGGRCPEEQMLWPRNYGASRSEQLEYLGPFSVCLLARQRLRVRVCASQMLAHGTARGRRSLGGMPVRFTFVRRAAAPPVKHPRGPRTCPGAPRYTPVGLSAAEWGTAARERVAT